MKTPTAFRLATALCAALISLQVGSSEAAPDEIHWTITGQTSVTFDWRGTENTIRFGPTTAYGQTVSASTPTPVPFSSSGPFWEAKLTGLSENTPYHYSIGGGPDHMFRTPPPRGSSEFTIYVAGDVGDATSYSRMAPLQATIAAGAPAFVLIAGDITYGNAHGQATVDHHFNDVMVWSQDAAYMPAWGNHEWDIPSADDLRNYKGRFDLPNPKTSPGSPSVSCCGEDWYWFDYGNVRFIAYPEPWSGAWSDWRTKAATVMDAAQADPAIKFIVTFGHRPAYSSGHHPGDSTLKGYIDGLGATHSKYVLNLNAHSHNYERSFPQSGVVHVTAGTGGSSLEQDGSCLWRTCAKPSWSAYRAMHMGSLKLHFTSTRIEGTFYCGPSGGGTNDVTCSPGSVMDAFVIGAIGGAPVVTAPSSVSGAPNVLVTFTVTASDPDGDAIASLNATPLPTGATFTANAAKTSGTFSWTPTNSQTGNFSVTFTASNALSGSATTSINVMNPDRAPVVTAPATATDVEGSPLTINVTASDPDGQAITNLTATGSAVTAGATYTRNASYTSGTLSWTPTFTQAGSYSATFTATNTMSGSATTAITVTNNDRAPAVTAPASASGAETTLITFTVTAADPDGETISTLTGAGTAIAAGGTFTSNAAHTSGTFSWTPAAGRAGSYAATFTATNALSGSATTAISVGPPNQLPTAALTLTPSTGNAPLAVTANASGSSDPDGSIASYRFDFGDGTIVGPQTGATAPHTYGVGNWSASVLVTDNAGGTATATASATVTGAEPGPNLVGNPSFESSTSGWNGNGGGIVQRVAGGYDGSFSLETRGPATGTAKFGANDSPNWVTTTTAAGAVYRFIAWVRSAAATGVGQLRVREYTGSVQNGATTYSTGIPLTPNWQMVSVDYPATVAGSTLDFQILDAPVTGGEIFQADNVSIRVVTGGAAAPALARQFNADAPVAAVVVPNPLKPGASLAFTATPEGACRLRIYDAAGRFVRTLLEKILPAGRHAVLFDGRDAAGRRLAAGVYFYRLETPNLSKRGRFVIVK